MNHIANNEGLRTSLGNIDSCEPQSLVNYLLQVNHSNTCILETMR